MKTYLSFFLLFLSSISSIGQESRLCQGNFWTEDEANTVMKKFASEWDDLESWEKHRNRIKNGIIEGMQLEKMPQY